MSVLVKGMKIPENCWECTGTGLNIGISIFGGMCPFCEKIRTDHDMQTGRHPDCPLTVQSEERTETHACDCIERQAAIDALEKSRFPGAPYIDRGILIALKEIKKLPPAQTDIVRCKDCRHGVDYYHDGDCYCLNPKWGMRYFGGSWEFYCAAAERRTDESD